MIVSGDQPHCYVIYDRDSIYSEGVDRSLAAMGLTVLRTPVRAPQANAFCERLVGTIRRECLDFVIPLNQWHPTDPSTVGRQLQQRPSARQLGTWAPGSSDWSRCHVER